MFEYPDHKKLIITICTILITVSAVIIAILISRYNKWSHNTIQNDTNNITSVSDLNNSVGDQDQEEHAANIINDVLVTQRIKLRSRVDYATALFRQDEINLVENNHIAISMAQNEKEGIEYIIAADSDINKLTCEISTATDKSGNTIDSSLYLADYTQMKHTMYSFYDYEKSTLGYYPDALRPYSGTYFSIDGHQSQTIYVCFETNFETIPGAYSGVIRLLSDGEEIDACSYEVNVWDLAYSEKTACQTSFGNRWDSAKTGVPGDRDTYKKFYDYLLDNRICGCDLPYEKFDNPLVVDYLNNDRVNSFRVYFPTDIVRTVLTSNNEWLEKAYYSPVDEPFDSKDLEKVEIEWERKNAVFPEIRIVTPFAEDIKTKDGQGICDFFSSITTLFCPNLDLFTGDTLSKVHKLSEESTYTLWWYVCGGQSLDTIDLLASTEGIDKRILFWQQYQNNVDGLLYWDSCYWEGFDYDDIPTTDGVLLYYDEKTFEPIGTLGLEAVRDGIEDYQLLYMGEEILGKDAAMSYVEKITTSIKDWDDNPRNLMKQRNSLAEAIIAHRDQ